MALFEQLKMTSQPILKAISLLLGKEESFLTEMTAAGENLMRALHYPPAPKDSIRASEHTDIDLMTILPYASEEGLEVEIEGKWVPVNVPPNALVVNVGDMLEAFSNGVWTSCNHRVKSTKDDTPRESIVFFIHPNDKTTIHPLGKEVPQYPTGTRLDYLFLRLFSLGLLKEELQTKVMTGSFIGRIESMVKAEDASKAVKRWYDGYKKTCETLKKS